jgi:hypothetical protein
MFGRFGGFPTVNITEIMMVSKSELIPNVGKVPESTIDAGRGAYHPATQVVSLVILAPLS